jgi:hypothetical protein
MAYATHYRVSFESIRSVSCYFDILEEGYVGSVVSLSGAGRSPVVHEYDASDILDPVRGSKVTVQYVYERSGIPVTDLLTTDEYKFRGDLYVGGALKFRGYMVISDFNEPYLYAPTPVTLTFTDGLAILDNTTLTDAGYTPRSGRKTVSEIILAILALTNIDLPFASYYNLFPYKAGYYVDRVDVPDIEALQLQYINTNSYLKNDDEFENCRTVLERILKANDSILLQEGGYWKVVRVPEYKRFSGNIPGGTDVSQTISVSAEWTDSGPGLGGVFRILNGLVLIGYFPVGQTMTVSNSSNPTYDGDYTIDFVGQDSPDILVSVPEQPATGINVPLTFDIATIFTTQSAPAISTIAVSQTGDLVPMDRTQLKSYVSPVQKVINTFNYRIPQLLTNNNLLRLGAFIGSSISGDSTFTDYQLSDWSNNNSEAAYIRVVTDTATGKETDRYMYMPFVASSPVGATPAQVLSVRIEVNEGDRFKLNLRYRAASNSSQTDNLNIGFHLSSVDGSQNRNLIRLNNSDPATNKLVWSATGGSIDNFSAGLIAKQRSGDADATEWTQYEILETYDYNNYGMPRFPFDGNLRIGIFGFNNTSGAQADLDCILKDFSFEYSLFVNDSIQIEGQVNTITDTIIAKNTIEEPIYVDSSPKFNVAGSVFCYDGTRVALAPDFRKESGETTNYSHGQINGIDELLLRSNWRTIMEGSFFGTCNLTDFATVENIDGGFVPYKLAIDYKQNTSNVTFMEVTKDTDESFGDMEYQFKYLYKV